MYNYWKIKAANLECLLRQAEAEAIRDRVFRAEGLDPALRYQLNDALETAEPLTPQGVLAPVLSMPPAQDVG